MRKSALGCLIILATTAAQAKVTDYLPEAKLQSYTAQLKQGYVGFGVSQQLLHVNAEWVNPYGIAYAKVGAFANGDHDIGGQVGFRYPYYLTGTDLNGYYIGAYAGQLESKKVDQDYHERLGAGIDLAYVRLDKERISTFSVGIGAAQKVTGRAGTVEEVEPQLQFAFSLSFGVY